MKLARLKKTAFSPFFIFIVFLGGCDLTSKSHSTSQKPTSITITKYDAANRSNHTTFTVKGKKKNELVQAIKNEKVVPKNAMFNCPSYSTKTVIWDYHIVLHYSDHTTESYTQTTNGCTFLENDQTGVSYYGETLPGLSPFGKHSK